MKTISQIAKELGVTKTTIRKHLTDVFRTQFAETINGIIYISEQGESLIKSRIYKNKPQTEIPVTSETISANQPETVSGVSDTVSALISTLQKELEVKNKQLEIKDKQIEELTETIKIQAESIRAASHNELAETIIDGQTTIPKLETEKRSFFNKLFSRNK